MIVKMKAYEKKVHDYSQKFKKDWSNYCIASDAYLNGYRDCKADILRELEDMAFSAPKGERYWDGYTHASDDAIVTIRNHATEEVEVEFKDGSHMTGSKILDKESSDD